MQFAPRVFAALFMTALIWIPGCETETVEPTDLEGLLERHVQARGGESRITSVRTVFLTGNYLDSGDATPFTEHYDPPMYLATARMLGRNLLQAYDGEITWWKMPPLGIRDAELIPSGDFRSTILPYNARHFGGFTMTSETATSAKLLGREDLDGKSMYKLEAISDDGARVWHYLDPVTFLEACRVFEIDPEGAIVANEPGFQAPDRVIVVYSDYRRVGGLMIAHRSEYWADSNLLGAFVVEKAELNIDIDPNVFRMPYNGSNSSSTGH